VSGQLQALLFDFDGLIIDSETVLARAMIETVAEDGYELTFADFGHLFGATGNDDDWRALFSSRGMNVDFIDLERRMLDRVRPRVDELEILPGVVELITAAKERDLPTGLATGTERRRVLPRLERLGLSFDEIVTAEDVGRPKPAPDVYLELARRLGVEPDGCIALEDSLPGSTAALAAGMTVVVCPCDVTRHCEFPESITLVESLLHFDLDATDDLAANFPF
jgi:HAD superfamily hydrolase (TIGR01509 family)